MPGNLVRIAADDVPLELLGPLGCGFQAGAGGVMRSLACPAGSTIAIFGGGPVGLAAVIGAVVQDCETIILVEPRPPPPRHGAVAGRHPGGRCRRSNSRYSAGRGRIRLRNQRPGNGLEIALAALSSHSLLGLVGVPLRPESSLSINLAALIIHRHRIHSIVEGRQRSRHLHPATGRTLSSGSFPVRQADPDVPAGPHQQDPRRPITGRVHQGGADPLCAAGPPIVPAGYA